MGLRAQVGAAPAWADSPACRPWQAQLANTTDAAALKALRAKAAPGGLCSDLVKAIDNRLSAPPATVPKAKPAPAPTPAAAAVDRCAPARAEWPMMERPTTGLGVVQNYRRRLPASCATLIDLADARIRELTPPPAAATPAPCTFCPEVVEIPGGSFTMGSPASEPGRDSDEAQKQVSVARFFAGKHEVTWDQWNACVADDGCSALQDDGFGGGRHPVTKVSWDETRQYTRWLTRKTGRTWRLLTEAEWEYAARARTTGAYWWGPTASHEYANYGAETCCEGLASGVDRWVNTSPAGQFDANGFGLHDMHGNVWEWVEDCYEQACSYRVVRGGSWGNDPQNLRAAIRNRSTPTGRSSDLGFRVARTP